MTSLFTRKKAAQYFATKKDQRKVWPSLGRKKLGYLQEWQRNMTSLWLDCGNFEACN